MSNFKVVRKIETDFDIPVTKYKSSITGLTAINAKVEGTFNEVSKCNMYVLILVINE